MARRNDNVYEKYKIANMSTNKVVCNVFMDAFGIEQVRLQNFNYKDKTHVDCYLSFPEMALLAADAQSGRLFKQIEADPSHKKTISMGGSKSSKNYDGAPESRILSLGKSGDSIFINMSRGKGKLSDTGAIMPDGKPDVTISVPVSVDTFRSVVIYTHDCVNAYLARFINKLVKECEADREKFNASK